MADRVARLARLLAQVRARSASGEPALAGLDWGHLALTGADLGAYTVQTIAGMAPDALAAVGWPVAPVAFVAISPFARQNRTVVGVSRARAPVLMVSAHDDVDAYGVTTDISLRHLAFDRLSSGDDYFFELGAASHRWLSGLAATQQGIAEAVQRRPAFIDETPNKRGRGGATRDNVAPLGDDEDQPPEASAALAATRAERDAQLARTRSRLLTHAALSEVGFEDVTVAFLDAYLRQDGHAQSWLLGSAANWLQNGDRLKHR